MKRSKKIGVLTGVLVAACVVTWAVMRTEEHKEKIKNSDEIILEIPEDKFTALSWSQDGKKLSIKKREMVLSGLTMRTVNFRSARRR